ncbi:MAG: PEP-CTERM sorting domain-containing protein [Phycisphaerales bacterium]|nr:PEP-CTERM sorting domain-containing protein [Phycisphaerales bacterium]
MISKTLSTACVATFAMASVSMGAILAPGSSSLTPGTDAMTSPHAYGSLVHSQLDSFDIFNSSGALLYQGQLESFVFQNALGELTFDLAIIGSEAGLNGVIGEVARSGFAGWVTDVDWRADAPGMKSPDSASRSTGGDKLFWSGPWSGTAGIFSGESSRMMFASTDATAFQANAGLARITLTTGEFIDIEVAAPVPAPGALALIGLAGCVGTRRRRRC